MTNALWPQQTLRAARRPSDSLHVAPDGVPRPWTARARGVECGMLGKFFKKPADDMGGRVPPGQTLTTRFPVLTYEIGRAHV